MRGLVLAALFGAAAVAGFALGTDAGAQEPAPQVSAITATFVQAQRQTVYVITVTNPSGPVEYEWSLQPPPLEPNCTLFTPARERAVWQHGDEHGCDHTKQGPNGHQGVVRVIVRLPGWTCRAEYFGSALARSPDDGPPAICTRNPSTGTTATTVTPTPPRCAAAATAGLFEPTQGVWQDDPVFEDRPGKQISLVRADRLNAEIPMAVGRLTVVVGVERVANSPHRGERVNLIFRGVTFGTKATPVQLRLTKTEGGTETELDKQFVGSIPLEGPCSAGPVPWEIKVPARRGLPARPFTFTRRGDYLLRAELLDQNDRPVGLRFDVVGRAVQTRLPSMFFWPVLLTDNVDTAKLLADTRDLARDTAEIMPYYYPVAMRPPRTTVAPAPLDLRAALAATPPESLQEKLGRPPDVDDVAVADVERLLAAGVLLAGHDRAILTTPKEGFARMDRSAAAAFAPLTKAVFVDTALASDTIVLHEIAHTLPQHLWSKTQMEAQCGRDYHNLAGSVANGIRLDEAGLVTQIGMPPHREPSSLASFMGAGFPEWTDQCTYRNLVNALQGKLDPPMTLVQGLVSTVGGRSFGALRTAHELGGVADLRRGTRGQWAIEVRSRGRTVARYPFEPVFHLELRDRRTPRVVVPVSYRIPRVAPGRTIALLGPTGVLDTLRVSASRPRVTVTAARRGTTAVVRWRATDRDRGAPRATVLYSSNGGRTWMPQALESARNTVTVRLAARGSHRVKVVVTDGVRTTSVTRALR